MTNASSFALLSKAVKTKIRQRFPAADHERVARLLLQYRYDREVERVHLDILEACEESLDKIRGLVELANQDYRDLIVVAEYDLIAGKLVLKPKFRGRRPE